MQEVKVEEKYASTSTSTKWVVRIFPDNEEPGGWLSDNNLRTGSRSEARVFDSAEEASKVVEGLGYEVVD